jgi:hypothetical protein
MIDYNRWIGSAHWRAIKPDPHDSDFYCIVCEETLQLIELL